MKLSTDVMPFLHGDTFHNGLKVKVSEKKRLFDRLSFLCDYAKDKKIIHVGCVDHLPLIEKKKANGTYLHQRLQEIASRQFGIDNNSDGIQYMKERLGYDNVAVENIIDGEINEVIKNEKWDLMIMGEILEHIDNPVQFMQKIHQRYNSYVKEIIITVPNAMAIANTFHSLRNRERINSDHRYWFSPYTLHKILHLSGFKPISHEFATYYPISNSGLKQARNIFLKYLLTRNPVFRGDLIMIAAF